MKILLVDDHFVVRQGVFIILNKILNNISVFQAGTISKAFNYINNQFFDLLILDVHFPKGSSLELLGYIKIKAPKTKVLVFSGLNENKFALRYIHAGADGYLNKLSTEEEMHTAIHTIIKNKKYISRAIRDQITNAVLNNSPLNKLDVLSDREMEVARLLVKGEGNIEIADSLNLSTTTVSTYKHRIFGKLQVNNVASLISLFNIYEKSL